MTNNRKGKKMKQTKVKVAMITGFFGVIIALITLLGTVYMGQKDIENAEVENYNSGEVEIDNSDDVIVNVGNGSVQRNEYNQTNEYNNFYAKNEWNDYSTDELLILAEAALNSNDYEKAYEIYMTERMQNNEIALCNLAYIHLNGYYVQQNFEKAKAYYSKAESNNGLVGLLAIAIWEENTEDILRLIDILKQEDDMDFWNYISFCQFGESLEQVGKENIIFGENAIPYFYQYEYTDSYYRGLNPPESTFLSKWIPVGIDTDDNFVPYIIWRNRELLYYKMINRPVEVDE